MPKATSKAKPVDRNIMIEDGWRTEDMVRDGLGIRESYWREWLVRNRVPFVTICGTRWFHRDQLAEWLKAAAISRYGDEHDA